ncbi:MAG: hypothetical protein WCA46_08870 [Actinocatenispora sp.]
MNRLRAVTVALLALTVVSAVLALARVDGPVRLVPTVAFLLTAPGWAITAVATGTRVSSARCAVAVAASLAVDVLAAQAMLLLGWHPLPAFAVLLAVTGVALVLHLFRPVPQREAVR